MIQHLGLNDLFDVNIDVYRIPLLGFPTCTLPPSGTFEEDNWNELPVGIWPRSLENPKHPPGVEAPHVLDQGLGTSRGGSGDGQHLGISRLGNSFFLLKNPGKMTWKDVKLYFLSV